MQKAPPSPVNGWLILNKPAGMTSTKAGSIVKRALRTKKLGHAGTLDPFATGVLPLALGEGTKAMPYVLHDTKEYEFELTFGEQRDTDDIEGKVVATTDVIPSIEAIQAALPQFTGRITQTPPIYSALRIDGERAYDLARRGEEVKMKPREVDIFEFVLISVESSTKVRFRVSCGAGTYIRSLGRDLAVSQNSLGYISQLHRTRVGKFSLKDAQNLDILLKEAHSGNAQRLLLPIRAVLDDIPAFPVSNDEAVRIRQGQAILAPTSLVSDKVLLLHGDSELAIADLRDGQLYPIRVFNL